MDYWLGLMSGTSMDAVDAVLVSFGSNSLTVHETLSLPYADALRQRLLMATRNQAAPDELGELDTLVGQHFAEAGSQLIKKSGIAPQQIRAARQPRPDYSPPTGRQGAIFFSGRQCRMDI